MLPESWITKIFSHFEALYGSKFHDAWKGTDLANVKQVWAEKLGGFKDKPQAIKSALDSLDDKPWPPTLPEFLHLCRDAAKREAPKVLALEHHLTEEEMQKNRDRIAQIQRDLAAKMGVNHADL